MKIKVDKEKRDYINYVLGRDDALGEDDTIVETADFGNGIEMDIKVCGVDDDFPYTEAVLFDHGCEVACTDPDDEFFGTWEFEYNGKTYEAEVE